MPPVSKIRIEDNVLDKLMGLLFEILGKNNNKTEFECIMKEILSKSEHLMIVKRIAIIYLLTKNIDYKLICHVLKVSPATVCKFKLINENAEQSKIIKKIINNEKVKTYLEELWLSFTGPGVPGFNWKDKWKQKNELERKKQTGI